MIYKRKELDSVQGAEDKQQWPRQALPALCGPYILAKGHENKQGMYM